MPEVAIGVDAVADHLLQLLDVGKPPSRLRSQISWPSRWISKMPPVPGISVNLPHFEAEGREHLLRHPGRAEEPVALGA